MADPYKDRSKERMPGILSNTLDTASGIYDTASNLYEGAQGIQTGKFGKLKYRTNLLNQIGENLYSAILSGKGYGDVGRSALEKSLFGIEFDVGGGGYIGAETSIEGDQYAPPTRGFRLNVGKRF